MNKVTNVNHEYKELVESTSKTIILKSTVLNAKHWLKLGRDDESMTCKTNADHFLFDKWSKKKLTSNIHDAVHRTSNKINCIYNLSRKRVYFYHWKLLRQSKYYYIARPRNSLYYIFDRWKVITKMSSINNRCKKKGIRLLWRTLTSRFYLMIIKYFNIWFTHIRLQKKKLLNVFEQWSLYTLQVKLIKMNIQKLIKACNIPYRYSVSQIRENSFNKWKNNAILTHRIKLNKPIFIHWKLFHMKCKHSIIIVYRWLQLFQLLFYWRVWKTNIYCPHFHHIDHEKVCVYIHSYIGICYSTSYLYVT